MGKTHNTPAIPATAVDAVQAAAVGTWLSVVHGFYLCDALMARRLAAVGVKTAEHEIIANLLRDPGIGQQTLAQRCFSAKSHISALLGTLEARGWVRREPDPADARAKRLYLTEAGEHMAALTGDIQQELVAAMCASESVESLLEVKEAMLRVSGRLMTLLDAPD